MMKYLYLTLLVFMAVPGLYAQKKNKKKEEPAPTTVVSAEAIRFHEMSYDFGKIPQGRPVHHLFTIENLAADTLKVENVQTSCGCTTPEYSKDPVLKGGKIDLKVGYNAAAEGYFEKSITVTYNGGQVKQLLIRGNVWKTPEFSVPTNQGLKVFN
ncbi:MAG: DUF1573 domain-containing protein [Bacteroidota bacterium]